MKPHWTILPIAIALLIAAGSILLTKPTVHAPPIHAHELDTMRYPYACPSGIIMAKGDTAFFDRHKSKRLIRDETR